MKQNSKPGLVFPVVITVVLITTSCTQKQNWTQFRGPDGNMVVASANLPEKWSNDTNVI